MKDLFRHFSIGHFINQPDNSTEFEIMQFQMMDEPQVDDIHKHSFYEIIWVEKGKSRQTIDYKTYTVARDTLFFISPGQVHEFEEWQPLNGGTIMFTENFFLMNQQNKDRLFELSFLDNTYTNPCLKPDKQSYEEIRQTIEILLTEKQRKDPSREILQSLLHILLSRIQRCVDKEQLNSPSKKAIVLFKKFKQMIDTHYTENITVADYAANLFITQHHLNHIVKSLTGNTATQVIRERSILEAKRLLTYTELTVSEIAAQLGYFDSSYFAKIFKAETGVSPTDFKVKISEKYRKPKDSF